MPNDVPRGLYKDAQEVHLRLKLVSAQECIKRLSKKSNLSEDTMLHLNMHLRFYFREQLKMYKNVKEKMHFMLHLMIHLTVQSK